MLGLRRLLIALRYATAVGFAVAAFFSGTVFGWADSLGAALALMGAFVAIEATIYYKWAHSGDAPPEEHAQAEPDVCTPPAPRSAPVNAYADAARVAITTEGVVLGLVVFQPGSLAGPTVKIGASSLVAGVLSALILYFNVAQGPPRDVSHRFAATLNLNVAMWLLAFGLICVVAGSWA